MESTGGLTPGGRFDRMEGTLVRIEDKLDRKADLRDLVHLDARVVSLEAGETPVGKILIEQFREVREEVRTLHDRGSPQAQEALRVVHDLQTQVAVLEKGKEGDAAVIKAARERALWRWRVYGAALAIGDILAVVLALFVH